MTWVLTATWLTGTVTSRADHDPTGGLDEAAMLLDWLPDARLHVITDAGHWPQWEKVDDYLRAHRDFLLLAKEPS